MVNQMDISIQIVSDIHLEHYSNDRISANLFNKIIFPCKSNFLLVLGDIGDPFSDSYLQFLKWCSDNFYKVFVITGNHEYYGYSIETTDRYIEKICKQFDNVNFMNNKVYVINNVVFIGTTLWSFVPKQHESYITSYMNDFKFIKDSENMNIPITVEKINKIYFENINFIETMIKKFKNYKIILFSHHTPYHHGTSHPCYNNSISNFAFSSDLSYLFSDIYLWAYGHTHHNQPGNILYEQTLLVSNQVGYPGRYCENYNNKLVIVL